MLFRFFFFQKAHETHKWLCEQTTALVKVTAGRVYSNHSSLKVQPVLITKYILSLRNPTSVSVTLRFPKYIFGIISRDIKTRKKNEYSVVDIEKHYVAFYNTYRMCDKSHCICARKVLHCCGRGKDGPSRYCRIYCCSICKFRLCFTSRTVSWYPFIHCHLHYNNIILLTGAQGISLTMYVKFTGF